MISTFSQLVIKAFIWLQVRQRIRLWNQTREVFLDVEPGLAEGIVTYKRGDQMVVVAANGRQDVPTTVNLTGESMYFRSRVLTIVTAPLPLLYILY